MRKGDRTTFSGGGAEDFDIYFRGGEKDVTRPASVLLLRQDFEPTWRSEALCLGSQWIPAVAPCTLGQWGVCDFKDIILI